MLDMDFPYQSERVTIGKGERLLLYTDGIPEAANHEKQLYESRTPLRVFVAGHTPDRARRFIDELIDDIRGFTGDEPQSDDITALYLLRHP
jgi:sigma-B regulation protein RsbU (phosphoserine phosphatase)